MPLCGFRGLTGGIRLVFLFGLVGCSLFGFSVAVQLPRTGSESRRLSGVEAVDWEAHTVTARADGIPRSVCVWILWGQNRMTLATES